MNYEKNLEKYQSYLNFVEQYTNSENAATGSKFDSNANVEYKNVATLSGETYKSEAIGINRLRMFKKIKELYGEEVANKYIEQLEKHEIYKHDETNPFLPYCVSISMYPFICNGLKKLGGISSAPKNLQSFCGSFINLVFAVASQFAGAVSTPEFLTYMDYFIRKEYGDDYYKNPQIVVEKKPNSKDKTLDELIVGYFQQVVYSINQPAAARSFQSVFWNIAYFDKPYFYGIFENFVFPDGTEPQWESVSWLQKRFIIWFNQERTKEILTFPVETLNLLDNGKDYVDQEWKDFAAEALSKGHSFFIYRSDSVDSLASCCYSGDTDVVIKYNDSVYINNFRNLYQMDKSFLVLSNGRWKEANIVRLPNRKMYEVTLCNGQKVKMTDNHRNNCYLNKDKNQIIPTKDLTTKDFICLNSRTLKSDLKYDKDLTYEQGFVVGCKLYNNDFDYRKYMPYGLSRIVNLAMNNNNVRYDGFDEFVSCWCNDGVLNLDCMLQSKEFRFGIVNGFFSEIVDNSFTTKSHKEVKDEYLRKSIIALLNSVGLYADVHNNVISLENVQDEESKRYTFDKNGNIYCRIESIKEVDYDDYVYCFEMLDKSNDKFSLANGIYNYNCRLRNELRDNTFSFTLGAGGIATGSKSVITINMNRLIQNAYRNNKNIEDAVYEQVDLVHKYLISHNELIKDFFNKKMLPVYDAGFISLDKQFLTIGINGLVEGCEFMGYKIRPDDENYISFVNKILKVVYEKNKADKTKEITFNTEMVPAENLGVKNAKWDKEDGYFVPRDCYNSYFYLVEDEGTNLLDKFILHGKSTTKYLDGGSALHGNLSEHLSKEQYLNLLNVAIKTGCPYWTINVPNTICNDCGHITKHRLDHCPVCGSKNIDYATRIIGYLKRVSAFSSARKKEEHDRYYE